MKVSVLIPVVRTEKAERCIEAIRANAGIAPADFEILARMDVDQIGCPKMVGLLTEEAKADIVCFLGDDTIPQPDFLKNALEMMDTFDGGWGLVGLSDGTGSDLPKHWIAHKSLLSYLDGKFFNPDYIHCFCDNELRDRCEEINRYKVAKNAVIFHDHPILNGGSMDDDIYYKKIRQTYLTDLGTYERRKASRWIREIGKRGRKLAIGVPCTFKDVPVGFWRTFAEMQKPDFGLIIEPNGLLPRLRNNIVDRAIYGGFTDLIMMDVDQTYPVDTIPKLMGHGLPIVGARVHRRYNPFDSLLYRGKINSFDIMKAGKDYQRGDLVRVDATGTGCLYFDLASKIFDRIEYPWFDEVQNPDPKVGGTIGEDIWFCHQVGQAGIPIHVDTSVAVGHLTTIEIDDAFEDVFRIHSLMKSAAGGEDASTFLADLLAEIKARRIAA